MCIHLLELNCVYDVLYYYCTLIYCRGFSLQTNINTSLRTTFCKMHEAFIFNIFTETYGLHIHGIYSFVYFYFHSLYYAIPLYSMFLMRVMIEVIKIL